jgi:hypothetical protein
MQPNLLLRPRRIRTRPQNPPHLLHTDEQNRTTNKPPHPLLTRGSGQTAPIRPKLLKIAHPLDRQPRIHLHPHQLRRVIEADHGGQLGEEGGGQRPGVDADGEDGGFFALGRDVHHVEFGFGAVAADAVVGGGVEVPTLQVDG